jgi:hypothetical protein
MMHECTKPIVEETHDIRCIPSYYYWGPSLSGGRKHSNVKFINAPFKEITSSYDANGLYISYTPSVNISA